MIIENANIEGIRAIAEELGINLIEQKAKHEREVKVLMRPVVGSQHYRALSVNGRVKQSLCQHGQYAFMSRVLARFPDALLSTWVNNWDYIIFQNSARQWTQHQIAERANYDTCDCTPELIASAMLSPDEVRGLVSAEAAR